MALGKIGDVGFLKCGLFGGAGTGKTYTGTLLLAAARKILGPGQFALFDTEGGAPYIKPVVKELMGEDLIGESSRSFDKLMKFLQDCEDEGVKYVLVDSISHVWTQFMDDFLTQVNQRRAQSGKAKLSNLEFSHWRAAKEKWGKLTTLYLNSPLHIVICGRAGNVWEWEENDQGKKELRKVGSKMKAEGEMAYEPSILVELFRENAPAGKRLFRRVGEVLKDRFSKIDGMRLVFECSDSAKKNLAAVSKAFAPHLKMLKGGSVQPIDTSPSEHDVDDEGDNGWRREKREREILVEELSGLLESKIAGTGVKGKRQDLLKEVFNTYSKTKIENFDSDTLRDGLEKLRVRFMEMESEKTSDVPEDEPE